MLTCNIFIIILNGYLNACFKPLSVLKTNGVNIDKYNPHKHKIFEILINISEYKGTLRLEHLKTTALFHER